MDIIKFKWNKLVSAFLLGIVILLSFSKQAQAHIGYASIELDVEKDTMSVQKTIVNATIHNQDRELIDAVGIIVLKDDEELVKKENLLSSRETSIELTYDFQKDLGLTLESDQIYTYIIFATGHYTEGGCSAVGQVYTQNLSKASTGAAVLLCQSTGSDPDKIGETMIIDGLAVGESYDFTEEEYKQLFLAHNNKRDIFF